METVYLDNSSTTKPCETSIEFTVDALKNYWGNPSSLHLLGIEAEEKLTDTRKAVSSVLRVRPDEIFFTGSGTEANNTAIFGAAYRGAKRSKRIVTTQIEHSSVLQSVKRLEAEGFEVIKLKPDESGKIREEDIKAAITPDTILVSIMLVNNETGAIQNIKTAAETIKKTSSIALLHCDAVQAFGKMPVLPQKLGVDLLTASAHKIHGPKGVGILYIKKGIHINPLILGGGQEVGMRSGTEAVPLIYGMCGAIKSLPNTETQLAFQKELWDYAKQKLLSTGLIKINSPDDCLPYIINISVLGYRSETLLHFLESEGIYVSSGSACSKGEGSYVLTAQGLDRKRVDSALRISFSRYSKKQDVDRLCEALIRASERLRKA